MTAPPQKDIVVLVADTNMLHAVRGVLKRHEERTKRSLLKEFFVHPHRDPGSWKEGSAFLRPFTGQYRYALLLFDHAGCGQEQHTREALENLLEEQLSQSGWAGRSATIIIDPELEAWVWSDSPHVASVLGWRGHQPDLRTWLVARGLLQPGCSKPVEPKMALEQSLREVRRPRSSALYGNLAEKVSLEKCTDPAFVKLRSVLDRWFPPIQ